MTVICCITPSDRYIEETRSNSSFDSFIQTRNSFNIFLYFNELGTLQFASRAKLVTTNATVNEVLDEGALLRRLQRELVELKAKMAHTESLTTPASGRESVQTNDEEEEGSIGVQNNRMVVSETELMNELEKDRQDLLQSFEANRLNHEAEIKRLQGNTISKDSFFKYNFCCRTHSQLQSFRRIQQGKLPECEWHLGSIQTS